MDEPDLFHPLKLTQFEKLDNLLSKERQESILNFRLTLRKKKIYNYLMDSRTKNEVKKNDSKINSRKKLFECKKVCL